MLSQLIADAESQLEESIECVVWYQRKEAKDKQRLASLLQLQQHLHQQLEPPDTEEPLNEEELAPEGDLAGTK